jgi:hypothetical protein
MRRIWATLLVTVFGLALTGPAVFVAGADQKLPTCCRKDGKHHCASASSHGRSSGSSFQAGRCAWFIGHQSMPPVPAAGILKARQAAVAAVTVSRPTLRQQTQALGRAGFYRTGQKRGPPLLS